MTGELVPLVSSATPAIRLVGAGVVFSVDLPYLRNGLLAAGEMLVYDEYPYKVVRQTRRLIGRPENDNWVTSEVTYEQDNPGRSFRVSDQLALGPLQSVYMRPTNGGNIAGEAGKSYAIVRFSGSGNIDLLNHDVNESLVIGDAIKMAAFVAVAMYAAPYVVSAVEAAIVAAPAESAFVGPVESPGIMGPFVPSDFAATTAATAGTTAPSASGWTLAEVATTAKTVGQTAVTVAQTAGTVGSVVSAVSKLTPDQIRAVGSTAKLSGAAAADINNLSNNTAALAIAGGLLVLVLAS